MGMDVYGKNATTDTGSYFRRNVWGWRPLWHYVETTHADLVGEVSGHYNDGDGLNAEDSAELARRLYTDLDSGLVAQYIKVRNEWMSELPREECSLCEGTGIRSDEIGHQHGMLDRELAPEVQVVTGRTYGYCNGCSGYGNKPHWETNYWLEEQDIRDFADFLANCGGFEIW